MHYVAKIEIDVEADTPEEAYVLALKDFESLEDSIVELSEYGTETNAAYHSDETSGLPVLYDPLKELEKIVDSMTEQFLQQKYVESQHDQLED